MALNNSIIRKKVRGMTPSAPDRSPTKEKLLTEHTHERTEAEKMTRTVMVMTGSNQKPQRTTKPTRKVLEAITPEIQQRPETSEEEL